MSDLAWVEFDASLSKELHMEIRMVNEHYRAKTTNKLFSAEHLCAVRNLVDKAEAYFRYHCVENKHPMFVAYAPGKMCTAHRALQLWVSFETLVYSRAYPDALPRAQAFYRDMVPYFEQYMDRDGMAVFLLMGNCLGMQQMSGELSEEAAWVKHKEYLARALANDPAGLDWIIGEKIKVDGVEKLVDQSVVATNACNMYYVGLEYMGTHYSQWYSEKSSADKAEFAIEYSKRMLSEYEQNKRHIEVQYPFNMNICPPTMAYFRRLLTDVWFDQGLPLYTRIRSTVYLFTAFSVWGYGVNVSAMRDDNLAIVAFRLGADDISYMYDWAIKGMISYEGLKDTESFNLVVRDMVNSRTLGTLFNSIQNQLASVENIAGRYSVDLSGTIQAIKAIENPMIQKCFTHMLRKCGYLDAVREIWGGDVDPVLGTSLDGDREATPVILNDALLPGPTNIKVLMPKESGQVEVSIEHEAGEEKRTVDIVNYIASTMYIDPYRSATIKVGEVTKTLEMRMPDVQSDGYSQT